MKIFGIGLHRTGNTSLNQALTILGYKSKQFPRNMIFYKEGKLSADLSHARGFDALVDTPMQIFYRELDREYPNSKFILTTRNINSWIESAERHFSILRSLIREPIRGTNLKQYVIQLYGRDVFNHELYAGAYAEHDKRVREYFYGRDEDILFFNLCGGDGWSPLCSFLYKPIPKTPFPHKNKSDSIKNILFSDLIWSPFYNLILNGRSSS